MNKYRIIVGGFLGLIPAGGVTWDYLQYPLGFLLMGHDVYYIEDTRLFPIYQKPGKKWDDASYSIAHLKSVMEHFGMKDRWAYRDEASGMSYGMRENKIKDICDSADIFINVSCSTFMRDEYRKIPHRILVDSDPMFTQIQYVTEQSFTPGASTLRDLIQAHNQHFTFGENIHSKDSQIPDCGIHWKTTRQPICLRYWEPCPVSSQPTFTTLMNWSAGKKISYNNISWGQKDIEFLKFMDVPKNFPDVNFSIVVNQTGNTEHPFPREQMEKHAWRVLDPDSSTGTWTDYRDFIQSSLAEFSVAKETYVKGRTGWFSCRSACYLASGKPVITQDTGWSHHYPTGEGLFSFHDMESAENAVEHVLSDPGRHALAARDIAEAYCASDKVLNRMVDAIM